MGIDIGVFRANEGPSVSLHHHIRNIMKWTGGLLLLASVVSSIPTKDDRAFSLFSVVSFDNDECTGTSGSGGICFTSSECTDKGGTSSGNCASGFGVCCIFTDESCETNKAIANNCTHIHNPGNPSAYTTASTTCSFQIAGDTDICQIRLDFLDATVFDGPTTGGCKADTAAHDAVSVTSPSGAGAGQFSQLCGTLTGTHLYVETARDPTTAATLTIETGTATSNRRWDIKVTMIACNSPSRAPTDCLQYHTGSGGLIHSINWGATTPQMLDNLNYQICIRKNAGSCGIQYTEASTTTDSFGLHDQAAKAEVGANCLGGNYITIEGVDPTATLGRFCGSVLADVDGNTESGVITSHGHQFRVGVYSSVVDAANSPGFNLLYTQIPC